MASTGCGKTLANARILYALADPVHGMRATFALGLRTLTLQTGRSYREDLNLGDDELAIRVGGSASKQLFEYYEQQAEKTGSASTQSLLEEDSHVLFEGQLAEHPLLSKAMADNRIHSLLSAPLLVCTVDHLVPATEAQRADRQIAPMLRLMSSDLVLDELDDFDLTDLPALTRLVYWAGLLGSRIVLSSATLPPSLVEGMFLAYRAGRSHYQKNRGESGGQSELVDIPCLWVDEFNTQSSSIIDEKKFSEAHAAFVEQRTKALERNIQSEGPKRCGVLLPLQLAANLNKEQVCQEFAARVREAILQAHSAHHEICPKSGKAVSFGLVRMANIEPLFEVAKELFRLGAPENYRIHICVYHARFPLLIRSAIEHQLDTTLNRRQPSAVYEREDIRNILDKTSEQHHMFVVLGSPVTEVGRDHDYDWAVVEPSSMRSLIQLAGRVQRHRQRPCKMPNVFIFDTNLRHFTGGKGPDNYPRAAFVRPGFEDENATAEKPFRLKSHRLGNLLREDEYRIISAQPRIKPRPQSLSPKESLVDLEHARLAEAMSPKIAVAAARGQKPTGTELNAACAWQYPQAGLTWALPQQQPFREDSSRDTTLVFLPDEDEEILIAHRIFQEEQRGKPAIYTSAQNLVNPLPLEKGQRIDPWGQHDMLALLIQQAEAQGQSLDECAKKFTVSVVPQSEQGWWYHPVLGFGKRN